MEKGLAELLSPTTLQESPRQHDQWVAISGCWILDGVVYLWTICSGAAMNAIPNSDEQWNKTITNRVKGVSFLEYGQYSAEVQNHIFNLFGQGWGDRLPVNHKIISSTEKSL